MLSDIFKRLVSVFSIAILLFNQLLFAPLVFAEEATPSAQTATLEISPSPSPIPTPEPAATPLPSLDPAPLATASAIPTPTPELTSAPEATASAALSPAPTATPILVPSGWKDNGDGSFQTVDDVAVAQEYFSPQNIKVKVTFTKLPVPSGKIAFREVKLTPEQIKQTGALSDTAYDISSTMQNGTFEYTLTLPTSTTQNVEVKTSEDGQNFVTVGGVSPTGDTLTVTGLNHFTIFVVTGTITGTAASTFDETSTSILINEFSYNSVPDWVELYNPTPNSIDLTNWVLVDNTSMIVTLTGTILPGGFAAFNISNRLDNNGDKIDLKDGSGNLIDEVSYSDASGTVVGAQSLGTVGAGQSVSRKQNGLIDPNAWIAANPTQGYTNENSTIYVNAGNTSGNEFGTNTFPFNTIQEGINAVAANGTVNVAAGTYAENLAINKKVTLQGAGRDAVTITGTHTVTAGGVVIDGFKLQGIAGSRVITIDDAVVISGGTISNNKITGGTVGIRLGLSSSGQGVDGITISNNIIDSNTNKGIQFYNAADYASQHISNITISGNTITNNGDSGISTYGPGPNTITNNTVSNNSGNGISIKYDNGDVISGNTVTGNSAMGINMHQVTNATVENNTVSGQISEGVISTFWGGSITAGKGSAVYIHENSHDNTVRLNTLIDNKIGVLIGREFAGVDPTSNSINNNNITGNIVYGTLNVLVAPSIPVNAINNWWGSMRPNWASILSGSVNYNPWYVNSGKTILSSAVSGSTVSGGASDVQLTSGTSGQADLPSGVTTIALSNSTFMDVSSSANTASGGNINIGGVNVPLNNFTSGTLGGVNLSVAQAIGDVSVLVNKAVKLASGTGGLPITLSNSSLSNVSVAIPDSTSVLAPTGWNGKIQPPKTGSSAGSAPSGFSIGNTIIEVGSADTVLLFDKPVVVTLSGVTGEVGYKSAGSTTWHKINTVCDSYDNPTNVVFPGECRVSNGTDTRIYTYHFTSFAKLDTVTATVTTTSSGSGSSGGSGGVSAPSCNDAYAGGAPTLLSATVTGNNQVTLTWSKALDPVTHYVISYGLTAGNPLYGNPNVGGKDTTSYVVNGLSGGTAYYFRVRAGNGCNGGSYSNEISATPGGGVVTAPATGFQAGVLGTSTAKENVGIGEQGQIKGETTSSAQPSTATQPAAGTQEKTSGLPFNLKVGLIIAVLLLGGFGLFRLIFK